MPRGQTSSPLLPKITSQYQILCVRVPLNPQDALKLLAWKHMVSKRLNQNCLQLNLTPNSMISDKPQTLGTPWPLVPGPEVTSQMTGCVQRSGLQLMVQEVVRSQRLEEGQWPCGPLSHDTPVVKQHMSLSS